MISVIIPTHNRCDQVKKLLENINELKNEIKLEVILVDNNSSDETYKVVNEFNFIKYIFEKNTAFTRARLTGALNSSNDILSGIFSTPPFLTFHSGTTYSSASPHGSRFDS